MKKRFGALGAFALTVATALSLTACGGHIGEPAEITASEAFNQKGLWFEVVDYDSVGKDSRIESVWDFDGNGNVTVIPVYYYRDDSLTLGDLKDLSDEEILEKAKQIVLKEQQAEKEDYQKLVTEINDFHARQFGDVKPITAKDIELYDTLHLSPVKFDLHAVTNESGNITKLETITASYVYPKHCQFGKWRSEAHMNTPGASPEYDVKNTLEKCEPNFTMSAPASAVVYDKKYVGYSDDSWYFLKAAKSMDSETVYILDPPDTKGITVD